MKTGKKHCLVCKGCKVVFVSWTANNCAVIILRVTGRPCGATIVAGQYTARPGQACVASTPHPAPPASQRPPVRLINDYLKSKSDCLFEVQNVNFPLSLGGQARQKIAASVVPHGVCWSAAADEVHPRHRAAGAASRTSASLLPPELPRTHSLRFLESV